MSLRPAALREPSTEAPATPLVGVGRLGSLSAAEEFEAWELGGYTLTPDGYEVVQYHEHTEDGADWRCADCGISRKLSEWPQPCECGSFVIICDEMHVWQGWEGVPEGIAPLGPLAYLFSGPAISSYMLLSSTIYQLTLLDRFKRFCRNLKFRASSGIRLRRSE